MKKIISLVFIYLLMFSSICLADIKTLSQSNIWNSTFNDQNNQFIITGNENNAKVSLILKPNQPAYIQITFPQAGYNFDDNTIVTFTINNHNIKLTKDLSNTNSQICVFQYTFNENELKTFVHELTSKKEADIELNDRVTSIALHGTSKSVSAVLKYVNNNHIDSLPAPFDIQAVNTSSSKPASSSQTNSNNKAQSSIPKTRQNSDPHHGKFNYWIAGTLYFVIFFVIYKIIIKPILNMRRRKKQRELYNSQKEMAFNLCKEEIQKQAQKLYIKHEQLTYYDDYGTPKDEKWIKEVQYFIENRIIPLLVENNLETFYSDLQDEIPILIHITATTKLDISSEIRDQLAQATDIYHPNMDPYNYEIFCAKELRKIGWEATATQSSGDQGADVIATKDGITLILQCKLYSKPVGNFAVQEINTAKTFYHADYAAVVSNASFTISARQIADSTKTALLHHDELQYYATSLINK